MADIALTQIKFFQLFAQAVNVDPNTGIFSIELDTAPENIGGYFSFLRRPRLKCALCQILEQIDETAATSDDAGRTHAINFGFQLR